MRQVPWTKEQDAIIAEHYPMHGPSWDGWDELIPDRSRRAVTARANRLGIKAPPPKRTYPKERKLSFRTYAVKVDKTSERDPYESYVLSRMEDGLAPSQIDREMHWTPGKASLILSQRWDRVSGRWEVEDD